MEREFGEFASEIEDLGISEQEEDKAVENPTITVKQQQKRSKNASKVVIQTDPVYQRNSSSTRNSQKTVFKSPLKKKEIVLLSNSPIK